MYFGLIKSFLPELYLSFCLLFHILIYSLLIKYEKLNSPLLKKEQLILLSFIFICTLLLIIKVKIEFIDHNFFFKNINNFFHCKRLILILSIIALLPMWKQFTFSDNLNIYEFYSYFLMSVLVLLLLISANDLIILYILFEMQTLIFSTLASLKRHSVFATEAGLKYFIIGAFFSGFYLLGTSILYGILGSVNFQILSLILFIPFNNLVLVNILFLAIFLITIVFLFKLAIAPFHFWAPDVYEGAPLTSTILISTLPKIVIIILLIKWSVVSFIVLLTYGIFFFLLVGISSIFIAIFFAYNQKRLKRFIAFSSIGQLGYIILLFTISDFDVYINSYFFIIIYTCSALILWYVLSIVKNAYFNNYKIIQSINFSFFINNFSNMGTSNIIGTFFVLCIFASLAGLPPFIGFLPKLFVFNSLIMYNKIFVLSILLILTSFVVWYYINIIIYLFMEVKDTYKKTKRTINLTLFNRNETISFELMFFTLFSIMLFFFFFKPNFILLYSSFCMLGTLL